MFAFLPPSSGPALPWAHIFSTGVESQEASSLDDTRAIRNGYGQDEQGEPCLFPALLWRGSLARLVSAINTARNGLGKHSPCPGLILIPGRR